MKKILVVLSLVCFVAVNFSKAQTAQANTGAKKEVVSPVTAKAEAQPAAETKGCCKKANAACCKNMGMAAKDCTPAQKAACEKMGDKSKAEAAPADKAKSTN